MARRMIMPGTTVLMTSAGALMTSAGAVRSRPGARPAVMGAALRRGAPWRRGPRRGAPWRSGLLLAIGWLAQAGLRWWFGRMQVMPLANPDETAYLIAARVFAGGPGADLSGSTLYPGGYPLLITPVYWFTSDPATVYHAVVAVNSALSALIMPLGYLACRRLGLGRPAAYGVAMVVAVTPAGFFYSQYAMADAIFPVITLAWLLTVHSWLTATSPRARFAAAFGSALLSGYAYMVHSRGLVMVLGYAVVAVVIARRRLDPLTARLSVVGAALTVLVTIAAGWSLDHHLRVLIYPNGTRSLSGEVSSRLGSVYGVIHVLEMAAGQLWRLTLDSWGIAGIGLVAAAFAVVRRPSELTGHGIVRRPSELTGHGIVRRPSELTGHGIVWTEFLGGARGTSDEGRRRHEEGYGDAGGGYGEAEASGKHGAQADLRIMAGLSVAVTVLIACLAPAALPPDQSQTWASGRYLDGMIITFFLAGAAVLLRENPRRILGCAAGAAGLFVLSAVTVAVYAGTDLPTSGFGSAFNFAEPAVLTGNWTWASVPLATAVVLGMLVAWLAFALARRWRPAVLAGAFGACVAAVSLVATAQMTSNVSRASTARAQLTTALPDALGLKPGEQVAIGSGVGWQVWAPEAFEVSWTKLQFFKPAHQQPPADVAVAELPWPAGQPAKASWPQAPAGWRIVASSRSGGWVAWRFTG